MQRPDDFRRLVDGLVGILRGLVLVGVLVSSLPSGLHPSIIRWVWLLLAIIHAFLLLLVIIDRTPHWMRLAGLGVDIGFSWLISWFAPGNQIFIGLLPIGTAAIYWGAPGGLLVALLMLLTQAGMLAFQGGWSRAFEAVLGLVFLYLPYGFLSGFLAQAMGQRLSAIQQALRKNQQGQIQNEQEHRRTLYQLVSALSATLNYQRVLEIAQDVGSAALGSQAEDIDRLVSGVLLFGPGEAGELEVASARRFTPADTRIKLPAVEGILARGLETRAVQFDTQIDQDPELNRVIALRSCKAAVCIPLYTGLETYGVLLFAHPEPGFFTAERREILDVLGTQAMIAIQNARLYRDLENEKQRIIDIQEQARKKLARDLHDGPTQSVAALAMRASIARRLLERDVAAVDDELVKLEDLARRTTKEIRHMLFTLRPLVLETQGLIPTLEAMAEKMLDTYSQKLVIAAQPHAVEHMDQNVQGVVFAIVEEAVNNARKHAQAESIWVRIKALQNDLVLVEIQDNGVGFDLPAVEREYENRSSLGLINMRERAGLINAHLEIEAAVAQGSRISLLIPVSEEGVQRLHQGS